MHLHSKSLIPIGLVSAALLAGCGGGGDDKRLSKADFVKKGNEICTRYSAEGKKLGSPNSLADLPSYVDKTVALFDKQLAEMRDLKPPKDLQGDYDKMLATGDDARKALVDVKAAAEAKDEKKITEIGNQASAKNKESNALATKIGLTECAKG